MQLFTRYLRYLANNPEGYWFKRKLFGWGWVPARWQGWVALAIFIALFIWITVSFSPSSMPTHEETLWYVGKVALAVLALLGVCYVKGEPPTWQWGFPEDTDKKVL